MKTTESGDGRHDRPKGPRWIDTVDILQGPEPSPEKVGKPVKTLADAGIAQAGESSGSGKEAVEVAEPAKEPTEPRRSIDRIERSLYAVKDSIFVFGFCIKPAHETEFVVRYPTLAPVLAWCYSLDLPLDDPVNALGPAVDQSTEAIDRREKAASTVLTLIEELRALEGVSFELLWAVRGESRAHLHFSADNDEHWALNSAAEMIIDELPRVLGW